MKLLRYSGHNGKKSEYSPINNLIGDCLKLNFLLSSYLYLRNLDKICFRILHLPRKIKKM